MCVGRLAKVTPPAVAGKDGATEAEAAGAAAGAPPQPASRPAVAKAASNNTGARRFI
jgi:hypothetical protein